MPHIPSSPRANAEEVVDGADVEDERAHAGQVLGMVEPVDAAPCHSLGEPCLLLRLWCGSGWLDLGCSEVEVEVSAAA